MNVGISGGIGSGKSYLCRILESKGFPVYYSDREARRLINENNQIREQLISLFGEEVYLNGEINRPFLAAIIFNDPEKRKAVNQIVHPQVHADFLRWSKEQNTRLVFEESALLFDNQAYRLFDATILVTAPLELRIERIVQRDACTREEALARINSQGDQEEFRKLATYCVENDEKQDLTIQVDLILAQLT